MYVLLTVPRLYSKNMCKFIVYSICTVCTVSTCHFTFGAGGKTKLRFCYESLIPDSAQFPSLEHIKKYPVRVIL